MKPARFRGGGELVLQLKVFVASVVHERDDADGEMVLAGVGCADSGCTDI